MKLSHKEIADMVAKGGILGPVANLPTQRTAIHLGITEEEFTTAVIDLARANNWLVAHFRPARIVNKDGQTGWRTAVQGDGAGFPDLILLRAGQHVVAELKRYPRQKPRAAQRLWLEEYRKVPGCRVFLWTPEDWPTIVNVLCGRD